MRSKNSSSIMEEEVSLSKMIVSNDKMSMIDSSLETNDSLYDESMDLLAVPNNCAESVEKFAKYVWKSISHHELPAWLRDNEFLHHGHRPELPSISACIKSSFRLHTETVNIWTHLVGALLFVAIAIYTFSLPKTEGSFYEKLIIAFFFTGAITCLFFSAFYHMFSCYSPRVSEIFRKLDYCGISILTMGSFVPWLYYAFYCDYAYRTAYLILISILGMSCIIASLSETFGKAEYRAYRAGVFVALGMSAIIPATHYIINMGLFRAFNVGNLSYLLWMAALYISGALLYAVRIPERLCPGKFDIWFQSHQIFHVCVVAAAYVHYHGINKLSSYRNSLGDCLTSHNDADYSFEF